MEVHEVTKAWDAIGRTDKAQTAIHPSGRSEQEYEASGKEQAEWVKELVWYYCLPHIKTEPRVADFGCGDGRVLKYVAEEFPDSWGIDASEAMLERLAERVPSAHTMQSDGRGDSLRTLHADFIYSLAVFIHHDHRGGREMLRGLAAGVKSGGFLALQIPVYDVERERQSWTDVTVWTEDKLRAAAKTAGLSVIELWKSPGEFSFSNVGENHIKMQLFRKTLL